MSDIMITNVLSLAGTLIGTLGGILISNRLSNYRIEQLEKKVDKHNHLIERMTIVEQSTRSAHHRIDEMKKGV